MATSLDLIESGAKKLGALGSGESLSAADAADGLDVLNSMLDYWAMHKLLVYQIVQDSYTWAGGNASRTIGTGGNFNGTRPVRIEEGTFFRDSNNNDIPVTIIRDRAVYDSIPVKTTQSTYPQYLYYDTAYPLGVLYAYPVPSADITLKLNRWQILQRFASLTEVLSLPPGYQWAIEHNMAVHLEPLFSIPCPASVVREASTSKAALMRVNHVPITSRTEVCGVLGGSGGYNILSGP